MRYFIGLVCVLALDVMPMAGCSDNEGTGGTGGTGRQSAIGRICLCCEYDFQRRLPIQHRDGRHAQPVSAGDRRCR